MNDVASDALLIFLPVRNGSPYIRQAVASIVAQDDPNWRLIVLENASTDDTVEVVRSFADDRIELSAADRPLNIGDNWHRAFERLRNERTGNPLVTFIGHDDYLYPSFTACIRQLAAAAPDATLYQTHFDLVDRNGHLIRPCRPVAHTENWIDLAAMIGWGLRDAFGTGYACRAEDYVRVGGIPRFPGLLYADHLLFLRLTRLGHKCAHTAYACAYRLHGTSMSNAVSVPRINERLEAFSGFLDAMDGEFGEFARTDVGRVAMTTQIAREVFVFDAPMIRGALTPANRAILDTLRRRMIDLGGSTDLAHWSYERSRVARTWGRLKVQAPYLRARLRGRS